MNEQLKTKWLEMAVREVSTQCMLARKAFDAIPAVEGGQYPFILIQALLSHCANVSKMLQALQEPQRMTRYEFGWRAVFARLRRWGLFRGGPTIGDLFGVEKSSPVHHRGRQFRNYLEHYDQRLFEWLSKYDLKVGIGDFNVMPKAIIKAKNIIWIRNLDPITNAFTFVGKDLDLNALVAELDRIRAKADAYLATLN